jgi:hypothetical protein
MFVSSQTDSIFVTLTGFIDNTISFNFQSKNCGAEWRYLLKMSIELIAIYFHSFEIFNIQIGEMMFCKPDFIIIKSNYFQNAQKDQCFLDDFKALVREIYVPG